MPRVIAKHVVQDHGWRRGVEQDGTRTSDGGIERGISHAQRRTKPEGCNSRGMFRARKSPSCPGRSSNQSGRKPASISARRPSRKGGSARRLAQGVHGLVGREAGSVGRDLEEDPVRLAEIETAEVEPVDGAAGGHADLLQPLRPARRTRSRQASGRRRDARFPRPAAHGAGRADSATCSSAAGPPGPIS